MNTLINSPNFIQFQAMSTDIEIHATETSPQFLTKLKQWFLNFEQNYSRFIENNQLDIFNKSDKWVIVESELFELLKAAYQYAADTDFYFNPFIGERLEKLGYDRPFEEIDEAKVSYLTDFRIENRLRFYPNIFAIEKNTSDKVDLGGFGKGWSVDRAATIMKNNQIYEGMINAGGDMFVWGKQERTIGISNPFNESTDIAQFIVQNGAIATSNKLFRSWKQGNEERHHILNGKTGLPSESDVVQATVFAKSTAEAEVVAKILCMLPFNEGIQWLLKTFPAAACVVINDDGKLAVSHTIKNYIKKLRLA